MLLVKDFLRDQTILRSPDAPSDPLISVVLSTYARRNTGLLERALSSVAAQTFTNYEFIVMDDGSRDGTYDYLESLREQDSRIVHVRHDRNSGLPGLRLNEGFTIARGKYVINQFDDDSWRPHALETLLCEAEKQSTPAVIIAKACFHAPPGKAPILEWVLPSVPVGIVTLYEQNRMANNAVLIPRHLLDRFGMYDCHIGSRRLYDWDLWLRLIKHVPFHVIDTIIGDVYEYNPGSLGMTIPWDVSLFRYVHSIPRDHLLTPANWEDYVLDSLQIGEVQVQTEFARRIYENHILDYYLKFRHQFPHVEGFSSTLRPPAKHVVFTKNDYDTTIDVCFQNYDAPTSRRGTYKAYFQVLNQIDDHWLSEADALMLYRTVEDKSLALLDMARCHDKPTSYYLDDNLFTFHEFGPQFAYLAPGSPYHNNLSQIVKEVDTVWVTTSPIADSVRPYNSRIIPHNNSVAEEWLPEQFPQRDPNRRMKIGYVGSNYRIEEFQTFWRAFQTIAEEFSDKVEFEFWGIDISNLPTLAAPCQSVPFTFSYFEYMERLVKNNFDILVTPLLDFPSPRLAKSAIKYYETAAAGALGIFSDVLPYAHLPFGETCLKAANTVESWLAALRQALTMPIEQFDTMRAACLNHVREAYTNVAQVDQHEAAWRATEFHALTRKARYSDGRPRIVYVLHTPYRGGGAENLHLRRLEIVRNYGVEPVVIVPKAYENGEEAKLLRREMEAKHIQLAFVEYSFRNYPMSPAQFTSPLELDSVVPFLESVRPALVHSAIFESTIGQACQKLGIPHVASMYHIEDDFVWDAPDTKTYQHCDVVQSDSLRYMRRWSQILGVEGYCSRSIVPPDYFTLGRQRLKTYQNDLPVWSKKGKVILLATFAPHKGQLLAIKAISQLRKLGLDLQLHLYGQTFQLPDYVELCHQQIIEDGLSESVFIHGLSTTVLDNLANADMLLVASDSESFPGTIGEATAAGVLVVATPAGGISEIIRDEITGILCEGFSVDDIALGLKRAYGLSGDAHLRIVQQARRVAISEFQPQRVANDTFTMYLRALEKHRYRDMTAVRPEVSVPENPPSPVIDMHPKEIYRNYPPHSPVLLDRRFHYKITPKLANWNGLDVLLGTHQHPPTGILRLTIYSETHSVLRTIKKQLDGAQDKDWFSFTFEPIKNSHERDFYIEIRPQQRGKHSRISLYEGENSPVESVPLLKRGLYRLGLQPERQQLTCRLRFASQAND